MSETEILRVFEPLLADGLRRLRYRLKPNADDVAGIFSPILESVARAAGGGESVIAEQLAAMRPENVTDKRLRHVVGVIVEAAAPKFDVEAARRHTAQLQRELGQVQ